MSKHTVFPGLSRPWTTRRTGECAFPVSGHGHTTLSCCAATEGRTYCPYHLARMRGPPAPDGEEMFKALAPQIG